MKINKKTLLPNFILIIVIITMIDGVFPRLQMILLNNYAPLPTTVLKLFLLLCLFLIYCHYARLSRDPVLFGGFLFIIYLLLDSIMFTFGFGRYDALYCLGGLVSYYLFPVISILIAAIDGSFLQKKNFDIFFIYTSILLGILGIYQYFYGITLIPVSSLDNTFSVLSYKFGYNVRGFSLFGSPLSFGHYLSLGTLLAFMNLVNRRGGRIFMLLAFLICFAAVYSSITRAAYFEALFSMTTFILIKCLPKLKYSIYIVSPIIYLIIGLFLTFFAAGMADTTTSGVTNSFSINVRISQWGEYVQQISQGGILDTLFGTGYFQTENNAFRLGNSLIIDNTYIAILNQIGVIGLLLYIIAIASLYQKALKTFINTSDNLIVGILCILTTYLFRCLLNIEFSSFFLLIVLIFLLDRNSSGRVEKRRGKYE